MIDNLWYKPHPFRWLLWPLSCIFRMITALRKCFIRPRYFNVPIIVVGNLSVGGVGKTPLVILIAKALQERGLKVGIVSRGYGASVKEFPHEVHSHEEASFVGDEPLLLAKKTGVPVVIAPRRVDAVDYLIKNHRSQVIISDDGLQHYAMGRAIEIAVIDGQRGLGNGLCLPAGPLREAAPRLKKVDFIVINGPRSADDHILEQALKRPTCPMTFQMKLLPGALTHILSGKVTSKQALTMPVAAVAAIGHPKRFFSLLEHLGFIVTPYPFRDHYAFQPRDFCFAEKDIVMTEKDAVKCASFAKDTMYYLPVEAQLEEQFLDALWMRTASKGYVI